MVKQHEIVLVVGDWSHDGHCISEKMHAKCSHPAGMVAAAYAKGAKKCGVDLSEDVCRKFEDGAISREDIEKLAAAGISIEKMVDDPEWWREHGPGRDGFRLEPDLFVRIYMEIARLGDPDISYRFVPVSYENEIHTGGYGLFS